MSCSPRGPWRFLTSDEARTVAALSERIIPTDQDPGAGWAGVVRFIDRQLAGRLRKHRRAYRSGLAAVDRMSTDRFGSRFVELAAGQQDEVLAGMESGALKEFFDLVVSHTMQGFYGDPRHGGNRDYVSWRMLGVPPTPVRGRLHYDLSRLDT